MDDDLPRPCEELLAQASVVLEPKNDAEAKAARVSPLKLDAAAKLYERVKQLDPNNTEAAGGLALVERAPQYRVDTHDRVGCEGTTVESTVAAELGIPEVEIRSAQPS